MPRAALTKPGEVPASTKARILSAAEAVFAARGFDGASTREIAAKAGVNIAGIAYHFGGKDRLYLACAEHIARTVAAGVTQRLAIDRQSEPKAANAELKRTLSGIAEFMLATPEAADFARFILREQTDPSPAFDILYGALMEPLHKRLCLLWAEATGTEAETERTKLKVFALISQVFFFRLARAGALRRLSWTDIGADEISAIITLATESVDALIDHEQRRVSP